MTFLTPEDFLVSRPNMNTYSTDEIQECINTSNEMINALTNGLSSKVITFNLVEDRTKLDTTNELYRTDFEFENLKIAYITQTQYSLQMGNNWTQGSDSISTGGINASFQRPTNRDIYAPTLTQLLRIARVFEFQRLGIDKESQEKQCRSIFDNYYTKDSANARFVTINQPNATIGNILYIDNNHNVNSGSPNSLNWSVVNANKIFYNNQYQSLTDISDLAWIAGTHKNVDTPEEVTNKINSALDKLPIIDLILFYAGQVLVFANDNDYQQFKQETNTTDDWYTEYYMNDKDTTFIYKLLRQNINRKAAYAIEAEQLDLANNITIRTINTVIEANKNLAHKELMDQIGTTNELINNIQTNLQAKDVQLETTINTNKTEAQTNLNNAKTELQNNINGVDAKLANYALKTGGNEFVGIQKFYVSSNTQPYPTVVLDSVVGASNYIGFNRNGRSKAYVGMGSKDNENLYIGTRDNKDLKFEVTGNINFNNKKLSSVGTPTDNTDAATKKYVDDKVTAVSGLDPEKIKNDILQNTTNLNNLSDSIDKWVTLGDEPQIKKNTRIQASKKLLFGNVDNQITYSPGTGWTDGWTFNSYDNKTMTTPNGSRAAYSINFNCTTITLGGNTAFTGDGNTSIRGVKTPEFETDAANKKYVDTVGAFLIPDNALGGYYVDGQVVSIVQTELVKDKIYIMEYRTNISHTSSFLNLTCVGVCLRGYSENNTFGPTEVYKRDNKICFILLTQKEKAVQNQNIRLFFMKNKQF